jgi:hypothetical protein
MTEYNVYGRSKEKVKILRVRGGCPGTGADEGRGYLRKVTGSWRLALIRECPNGETHQL